MKNRGTKVKKDCQAMCGERNTSQTYKPEIYQFRNGRGDAVITSYSVFPGIELAFYSVHMDRFFLGEGENGDFIEICHCREGRMEQERGNRNVYCCLDRENVKSISGLQSWNVVCALNDFL